MNQQTDPLRSKMVIDFFNNPQSDKKLNDLCHDFIARYNFTSKRLKYGNDIFKAVQKDIASVLNYFYTKENLISLRNFHRIDTKEGYLYSSLPKTTSYVLPKETSPQLALDFEQKDEQETPLEANTTTEENCPLFEDIKAADSINNPDLISAILENYQQMNIYNLEEITFIATRGNKKITINISNA